MLAKGIEAIVAEACVTAQLMAKVPKWSRGEAEGSADRVRASRIV